MGTLHLRLLGPPEVRHEDDRLGFRSDKTLALLVYLVVEKSLHPREQLAALFWPESGPKRARANLRNTLNYLRRALPRQPESKQTPHLIIEREALGFDFASEHVLDLDAVESAAVRMNSGQRGPVQPGDTAGEAGIVTHLQQAVEQVRGDFLDGFSLSDSPDFDEWVAWQREYWWNKVDAIFDMLAQQQMDGGEFEPAVETVQQWLAHHPANERAYRRLMRLHLLSGDRTAALHAFETCREILAAEYDLEPAPETERLAERIRDRTPSRLQRQVNTFATALAFGQGPLVGRRRTFASLVTSYKQTVREGSQFVLVVGEAGIGKTRLVQEFLAWAAAQAAHALRGCALETGRQLPYHPIIEALRRSIDQENAPDDLVSDVWLAELGRLVPELYERYPDLKPPVLEDRTTRVRLFEGVAHFIQALADRLTSAPLLFCIDDLHWADPATFDMLHYLAHRWREQNAPILLLAAMRTDALTALESDLASLTRELPSTTLVLDPLTRQDIRQFLEPFAAPATAPAVLDGFGEWLFDETEGQPFYLVETLQNLLERKILRRVRGTDGRWRIDFGPVLGDLAQQEIRQVPEQIRLLIATRIGRLTSYAQQLLTAGAVLGQDFSFDLLCRVSGIEENIGLVALEELLYRQLWREQDTGVEIQYIFTHDMIRDVVCTCASATRRRVYHNRALENLATMDVSPERLAYHAHRAGQTAVAAEYSRAAGEAAMQVFATRVAIGYYQQARGWLDASTASLETLRRLYLQWGRAWELDSNYDQALAIYAELAELAQRRGDPSLELDALMARITVYTTPNAKVDLVLAPELLQQALTLAQELDDQAAQAKVLWNWMRFHLFAGNAEEAAACGEASLELARRAELPRQLAFSLHDLGRLYLFSGRPDQGIDHLREAGKLWQMLDDRAMLADNLATRGAGAMVQGEYDRCLTLSAQALGLNEVIDNLWGQAFSRMNPSLIYFDRGEFGRALETMETCIRLGEQAGFAVPLLQIAPLLGFLYGLLGDLDRGATWVERSLSSAQKINPTYAPAALAVRSYLQLQRGDLDAATTTSRTAFKQVDLNFTMGGAFIPVFCVAAEVALARGHYEQMLATADDFLQMLSRANMRPFRTDALYYRGLALLMQDRAEEAVEALTGARLEAEQLGARRILWPILKALADAFVCRGNEPRAADLRGQARTVVEEIASFIPDSDLRASFRRVCLAKL